MAEKVKPGEDADYDEDYSVELHPNGFLLTTCVGTVAMFVVDSKSTVIKLTVQELETHLLGKEFSGKPQMCKENSSSAQLMSFRSFRHHLLECEYFQGEYVTSQTAVPQIESLTENESIDGCLDVDFDVAENPMVCEKQVQKLQKSLLRPPKVPFH
ncbi:hypothetical protein DAPPUDRAFT_317929 [Daphnia pulex]|uniref:Uncharacterized protein n=1 Tax=Daphnia pulex TaxID=6669 RepID=E9GHD3_DAPPU|nr:hypothetical protein DAPPUDRAFT_317929 [Daphnia pulex]|eukprot:EFX81172.1 hypothetical protein DAPPUDRAFT_317929 [Daphnia pulex]